MSMWVTNPELMANAKRRRERMVKALKARGVMLENEKNVGGWRMEDGRIFITARGLREIWRRVCPGEPLP